MDGESLDDESLDGENQLNGPFDGAEEESSATTALDSVSTGSKVDNMETQPLEAPQNVDPNAKRESLRVGQQASPMKNEKASGLTKNMYVSREVFHICFCERKHLMF